MKEAPREARCRRHPPELDQLPPSSAQNPPSLGISAGVAPIWAESACNPGSCTALVPERRLTTVGHRSTPRIGGVLHIAAGEQGALLSRFGLQKTARVCMVNPGEEPKARGGGQKRARSSHGGGRAWVCRAGRSVQAGNWRAAPFGLDHSPRGNEVQARQAAALQHATCHGCPGGRWQSHSRGRVARGNECRTLVTLGRSWPNLH